MTNMNASEANSSCFANAPQQNISAFAKPSGESKNNIRMIGFESVSRGPPAFIDPTAHFKNKRKVQTNKKKGAGKDIRY